MSNVQEFTVEALKADRAAWPQLPPRHDRFIETVHPSEVDWDATGESWHSKEHIGISRLLIAAEGRERIGSHLGVARDQVTGIPIPTDSLGRILPREEFESIVGECRKFYDLIGTPDRITRANEEEPLHSVLSDGEMEFPDRADRPGTVYVVTAEHGFYKIGKSENLESRLRALSTASPFEIRLILSFEVEDMVWFETVLHRRYGSRRTRGEWFKLTDGDVVELKALHALMSK